MYKKLCYNMAVNWRKRDMITKEVIEQVLNEVAREIQEIEPNRMNAMLGPQPIGYEEATQTIKIRYMAKEWQKNHRGEIHGGVVAAMFDTAMGMSVIAFAGYPSVSTADLDVSYIRPFNGSSFIFEVEIIHPGRRITRVRAKARDEVTGKTLASSTANFVPTNA